MHVGHKLKWPLYLVKKNGDQVKIVTYKQESQVARWLRRFPNRTLAETSDLPSYLRNWLTTLKKCLHRAQATGFMGLPNYILL